MKAALLRFLSRWPANLGVWVLFVFLEIALAAPILAPVEPAAPNSLPAPGIRIVPQRKQFTTPHPPSENALLGTTRTQRDVFYGLVWGIRQAMRVGLTVSVIAALAGSILGAAGGYLGGAAGRLILRITDGFLTIPVIAGYVILLTLQKSAILRLPNGGMIASNTGFLVPSPAALAISAIDPLMWAMVLLLWMPYARMMYMMILKLRRSEFVQASEALGAGPLRVIFGHLVPNAISPILVMLSRDIGAVIILQASITFAGFDDSSLLGSFLLEGKDWILFGGSNSLAYWWVWLPPALALVLFGIAWGFVGDGLNEVLNPYTRR